MTVSHSWGRAQRTVWPRDCQVQELRAWVVGREQQGPRDIVQSLRDCGISDSPAHRWPFRPDEVCLEGKGAPGEGVGLCHMVALWPSKQPSLRSQMHSAAPEAPASSINDGLWDLARPGRGHLKAFPLPTASPVSSFVNGPASAHHPRGNLSHARPSPARLRTLRHKVPSRQPGVPHPACAAGRPAKHRPSGIGRPLSSLIRKTET